MKKNKNSYIQIRVNEDFKKEIEFFAGIDNKTVSGLVTDLLTQYIKGKKDNKDHIL